MAGPMLPTCSRLCCSWNFLTASQVSELYVPVIGPEYRPRSVSFFCNSNTSVPAEPIVNGLVNVYFAVPVPALGVTAMVEEAEEVSELLKLFNAALVPGPTTPTCSRPLTTENL